MAELSDEELIERFSGYRIERDNRDYYRAWLDREVRISRCDSCGRWQQPPRPMCPACWSWDMTPTSVSGRGRISLITWLHQGSPAPGVDYSTGPHPVVAVELEEQPNLRVTSTVTDAPPERIAVGAAVELVWLDRAGLPVPAFRLADTAPDDERGHR